MFTSNEDTTTTASTSKTPNCETSERSTSPVLSNTKRSYLRMAKYRSRKKLLSKFASSQESVASSFTDSESFSLHHLTDSQVSEDFNNSVHVEGDVDVDIKARFKRIKELQQQKKFHYDIVKAAEASLPANEINNSNNVVSDNCDRVSVGFQMVSGKKVCISEEAINKFTKLLIEDAQKIQDPPNNLKTKSDVLQTQQITDTQIILAAENAESMLELVDNQWTPDSRENSENFNISSINFDSQWGVSPKKTQSINSEETPEDLEETLKNTDNSEDPEKTPDPLNISCLENLDTQCFFSPKKLQAKSETSSDWTSPRCDTISVVSSQDFTLHITEEEEEEDEDSPSSLKKSENGDKTMKTFFGVLSFSLDGSTLLRQCSQPESNMQLLVKKDSWIFDVSFVEEDTLGFNSKYWKFYAKKYRSYIESFERHILPQKCVEIDTPSQKHKKSLSKKTKKHKPINNQHNYHLRGTNKTNSANKPIENLKKEEQNVFKVPVGVPLKTTPKSSKKQKETIDNNLLEENLHKICGSSLNEGNPSSNDILEVESEANYYIPNNKETKKMEEKIKKKMSIKVSIQLKNIIDFTAINKGIKKKNEDLLEKVKQSEPNRLEKIKEVNLKYIQEKEYIKNVQSISKTTFAFTTASGKKSEVSKTSLNKVRNVLPGTDTNNIGAENLDDPIEGELNNENDAHTSSSMNEEDFIENIDKILELIEEKPEQQVIEKIPSPEPQLNSGSEEKLLEEELSSPIQKAFMEDFITSPDFVTETNTIIGFATASGGFEKISEKALEEIKKKNNSIDSAHVTLDSDSTRFKKELSTSQSRNEKHTFTEDILPPIVLNENSGFTFVSGKKPVIKQTNIFNDIFGNGPKPPISKKEEQLLDDLKNISEDSFDETSVIKATVAPGNELQSLLFEKEKQFELISEETVLEQLPPIKLDETTGLENKSIDLQEESKPSTSKHIELEKKSPKLKKVEQLLEQADSAVEKILPPIETIDNPGFSFVSGRKPTSTVTTESKNIFSDIFNDDINTAKSKKEKELIEQVKHVAQNSTEQVLPLNELNLNTGFTFVSGKKPSVKPTSIFNDIFGEASSSSKSKKEEQFIKGIKNVAEDSAVALLPPIELKENMGFCSVSGKKPVIYPTNIFEDETKTTKPKKEARFLETFKNISEAPVDANVGFSFVSGRKPALKETNIFNDIFQEETETIKSKKEEEFLEKFKNISEGPVDVNAGFSFVSGKKPVIKETNIFNDIFEDETETTKSKKEEQFLENFKNISEGTVEINAGFSFVSGKKPVIKETNIFNDIFQEETETTKSKKEEQFLHGLQNITEEQTEESNIPGFSFVSGKKPATKSTDIFKDIFESESSCIKSTKEKELLEALSKEEEDKPEENNNKNTVNPAFSSPLVGVKRPFNSPQIAANSSTPLTKRPKLGSSSKKRSLGSVVKSCRQLNLSEHSAKKAKLIFEDFDVQPQDPINITTNSKHFTSTPINKETPTMNTSLLNTSISMKETNETLLSQKLKTTPTKAAAANNISWEKHIPTLYSFEEPKNPKSLLERKHELKLELSVIQTRSQMLEQQESIMAKSNPEHRRQRTGCLLCQKSRLTERLPLKQVGRLQRPIGQVDNHLLQITPENALNFQIFVPWWPNDNRTYPAVIRTEDGATIIPNRRNYIGVHEIEHGFLAMPGVDPKLIPENWIRNHYKWIVWKFASYERNLQSQLKGIMTVDNIVAQLKYRYDREIDLAQRPSIRRILEMDDSPAKRIVLCVSNIFKSHQNELELTDGWYSIRTLIDPVLNSLINTNKIYIGLKLMIHGAELLNCEGCPPLETPANVRLQIHFNSTRRAAWYTKLGYQPNPGPLGVSLHTTRNQGGPVGLTTVYIARVYPVCFMEHGEKIIWRDRKAERKRANQWESMQKDLIEMYFEQTKNEFKTEKDERIKNRKKLNKISLQDVCNVQDAVSLYELWEECNDPESLTELLSEEQCCTLKNYQMQQKSEEQVELAARLRKKLDEKNIKNRNVSSVLKLVVVDVNSLYHHRILSIWRPTDTHLQDLKEGECVDFYNLTVKDSRNLSSTPRSRFTLNYNLDKTKFDKFERKIIPINETKHRQIFDEFDTVGFVIEVNNDEDNKYMWIVDENKTLLLIRIRSTYQIVSILDGVGIGKVVLLQNLVQQKATQNYGIALANCYTNLYIQPHQPYLQDCMSEFLLKLPKNITEFYENCQSLVDTYKTENDLKLNELSTLMMYDSRINKNRSNVSINTVGFETEALTVSDEEMSLIDTQYF